jgi:spore coat polysaccharide biosynthesis protein SpsF (cytidylyltransferase family)
VEEQLDINIREFTVAAVEDGNFFAHKWYVGCEPQADATVVKKILDDQLKSINADYSTERSEVLGMEVETLPIQLFYDWQRQRGKMGGQNKFPRVMKPELFKEWQAFVHSQIPSEKHS